MRVRRNQPVEVAPAPAGIPITKAIRSHGVTAREIIKVGPGSDVWTMEPGEFGLWLQRVAAAGAFVWLDHPDLMERGRVNVRLTQANIPVGFTKQAAVDAVVSEAVAASTENLRTSIQQVVLELVDAATPGWSEARVQALIDLIETELERQGV